MRLNRPRLLTSVASLLAFTTGFVVTGRLSADETLPKLGEELQAMSAGFAKKAPAAMKSAFAQGIEDVRKTGIVDSALKVGDKAVDSELTAIDGSKANLASMWAEKPLVLVFYRGGWCPYCNAQLRALEKSLSAISGAGAQLVAVAPELPEKVKETARKNDLSLTVMTDPGNALAKKMGIAFRLPDVILPIYKDRVGLETYNGDASYELPLAATYVIDSTGVIRYAFLDADYKKRAEPAEIVAAVQKIAE